MSTFALSAEAMLLARPGGGVQPKKRSISTSIGKSPTWQWPHSPIHSLRRLSRLLYARVASKLPSSSQLPQMKMPTPERSMSLA